MFLIRFRYASGK